MRKEEDMTTFAERLREKREEHGLTQGELAELAGITAQWVSKYETGKALPSRQSTRKGLCDALEVTDTWLYSGTGEADKAVAEQKTEEAKQAKLESERIVYSATDRVNIENINLLIKYLPVLPLSTDDKRRVHATLSSYRSELESKVLFGERRI